MQKSQGHHWRSVIGYVALFGFASLVSVAISYWVAVALTRQHTQELRSDAQEINTGRFLRSCANELGAMLDELHVFALNEKGVAKPGAADWMMNVFQPQLRALRRRVDMHSQKTDPIVQEFAAALDRLQTMTARFGDVHLRQIAILHAAIAIASAEGFVVQHSLEPHMREKTYQHKQPWAKTGEGQ